MLLWHSPRLSILLPVSFGAVSCWLLLRILIPLLRQRLLDHPNARSSHCKPVPRGGGIAFVVVTLLSSAFDYSPGYWSSAASLPLLAAPLSLVGLLDDRHSLPASLRYFAQLLTASLILFSSPLIQHSWSVLFPGSLLFFLLFVLFVISFTAVINFTNFMDGLDGLVAGCMFVVITAFSFAFDASLSLWVLIGSLLAFLFCNWSPAKVFMGDSGSTFLGAVLAGLVFYSPSWPDAIAYLFVATPLLADASVCVFRRLLAGQRVFQAHRLHLYQRLHQAGWSHSRVSLTYISATVFLAVAMHIGGLPWVFILAAAELLFGVWLDHRFAVPFAVTSKS